MARKADDQLHWLFGGFTAGHFDLQVHQEDEILGAIG